MVYTDTTRHYTEARFRPQSQDMLLVDLVGVSVRLAVTQTIDTISRSYAQTILS